MQTSPYFGSLLASRDVPGARLVEAEYRAGECIPQHIHESAYLSLVLRGGYTERVSGTSQLCYEGMTIFHPAGERHSDEFSDRGSSRLFMIEPSASWLQRRREQGVSVEGRADCRRGAVSVIAQRIYYELGIGDQYSDLVVEGLLLELAAFLARKNELRTTRPPSWLLRIRERLREEYSYAVSIEQLAAEEHVTSSELARGFRRYIGCTAGEDLRRIRIEAALRLLGQTRKPVAEVALDCGFASQSHFSISFRRATGYSPRQFRSLNKRP